MRNLILCTLSICVIQLFSTPANCAIERKSKVSFEDVIKQDQVTLAITGTGLRTATLFNVKVYAIAHYIQKDTFTTPPTPEQVAAAVAPKRIVMHFLRKVDKKKMRESYEESLKQNNPNIFDHPKVYQDLKPSIDAFLSAISNDMSKNERFELHYIPKTGIKVVIPQTKFEKLIASPHVALMVWKIWFGAHPPQPGEDLQQSLLKLLSSQ